MDDRIVLRHSPAMLNARSAPRADHPLQQAAADLLWTLDQLFQETGGNARPDHPTIRWLEQVLATHGKSLWGATVRGGGPEVDQLRSWLRDLATAPAKEWAEFRQRIIPLVRCIGDIPRAAGEPLLTTGFESSYELIPE